MSAESGGRQRVLVVEDDPGIRTLLQAVLCRADYECEAVENATEAIALLTHRKYEALVLDLLLPRVSGYDLLEWLQESRPGMLSRVVILTASRPDAVQNHGVTARSFKVLYKPFDIEELLDVVRACVEPHKVRDRAAQADPFLEIRRISGQAHADAGVVGIVSQGRDRLHLIWSFGYGLNTMAAHNPVPISLKSPMSTSILEGRSVWMPSRSAIESAYPSLAGALLPRTRALAAVPIMGRHAVSGSIGWSFAEEQSFAPRQQQILLDIAAEYGEILAREE